MSPFQFFHNGVRVVTNLCRASTEVIQPINNVALTGQGLNWTLSDLEVSKYKNIVEKSSLNLSSLLYRTYFIAITQQSNEISFYKYILFILLINNIFYSLPSQAVGKFEGKDTSPEDVQDVKGQVVTKMVDGVPERLFVSCWFHVIRK